MFICCFLVLASFLRWLGKVHFCLCLPLSIDIRIKLNLYWQLFLVIYNFLSTIDIMFLSPLAMFIGQINLISDGTLPCLHRTAIRHSLSQCARGFGFENVFASFWFWKRFEIESKTDFNCKRLQSVAKHGLMEVLNTF